MARQAEMAVSDAAPPDVAPSELGGPFPVLLAAVRASVDRALTQIWEQARSEHGRFGPGVSEPLEAARDLCLRGGKRLRAGLVAVGYCLGRGDRNWEAALPACSAVELLQAYFLIHDDWMDQDR